MFGGQVGPIAQALSPEVQREQPSSAANAAALAHQQEQRGVSQLQNAVSVAAGGHIGRQGMVSPSRATTPSAQAMNGSAASMQQGGPNANMEKRGPVEFNHAISYVNKIKVSHIESFLL